ncbi:succinylglutamate desuccinylase [Alkalimonas amylolytica]|uniref:Succinylglutamate desuccinylase n=1 Tax=Alkalimonas amylolytica TaxID=152573 RepID=A0A1H3ZD62_ALKAM|nr:succinylglutamate desuccinylase [Alkalimonas amylolytica]SEA21607.1 succinylglutamate desuccinylase [Alkalimonas amylolytica]
MSQQWIPNDDFLRHTLNHPAGLSPCEFRLENGVTVQVWDTGVICFEPAAAGDKDIVLSCGVHGNETAPIEICAELVQDMLQQKLLPKQRTLVLIGNPAAINAGKREVEENLNRLFSGHHSKGAGLINDERKRALTLEQYVTRFYQQAPQGSRKRYLYDLHTAIRGSRFEKFAVYPFLHGKPWQKNQLEFLRACGVSTVLLMQTAASTFSYYASNTHGADAFTVELGKVRPFGQNDMSRFSEVRASLRALVADAPLATKDFAEADFQLYEVYRSIHKQTQDFKLHFADDVENFTTYPVGTLLATDGDTEYRVEKEGEALIFPNAKVAVGQRAMLMVVPRSVKGQLA